MSVKTALFWGVLKYMPSGFIGQSVQLSACDQSNNCVTGNGTISFETDALMVSGQVNIQSVPFTVDTVYATAGINEIVRISGVNMIVDMAGQYTITIREVYKLGLPMTGTVVVADTGSERAWTLKSSLLFSSIKGGRRIDTVSVQYLDGNNNVLYTDSNKSVKYSFDQSPVVVIAEVASSISKSGTLCSVKLMQDSTTAAELSANASTECLNITESANFSYSERFYVA
jgi:hypothetical protein